MKAKDILKNPITIQAMKSAKQQGRKFGTIATLIIVLNVLNDNYDFTVDQLKEFYEKVDDLADSMVEDFLSLSDIVKGLDEYYGLKLPEEDIKLILGDLVE